MGGEVLTRLDVVLRVVEVDAQACATAEKDERRVEVIFAMRIDDNRGAHDGPAGREGTSAECGVSGGL